jgi:type IV secretion system protein TrbL
VGIIVRTVGTLWVYVPTLHPTEGSDYTPVATTSFIRSQVLWIVVSAAALSIIIAGIRMAWQGRGEPARELFKSLLTLVLVSGAGLAFVTVLTEAGDMLAASMLDRAVEKSGKSFADNIADLVTGAMIGGGGASLLLGVPIILAMGFTAFLVSMFQIMLMIVRNGMLILLSGVLPLAAAATNTEMGKSWFKKICSWLVVFIVYKPVAALIYATAIVLGGSQGNLMKVMTGVVMMVLSIIALPALLRLVSPPGG